jgi:hypothetical protein
MTTPDDHRYYVSIGHPLKGVRRDYKTLAGARRGAAALIAKGERATIWEGTLRAWGGWSWRTVHNNAEETE